MQSVTHTQLDAFVTSGPSPTLPGIHLVGPGQVGRELLTFLAAAGANVVAVSDSTGTIRGQLDPASVRAHKAAAPLAAWPGAERVPLHAALDGRAKAPAWTRPFVVFGVNSILAYVGSGVVARLLGVIKIADPAAAG